MAPFNVFAMVPFVLASGIALHGVMLLVFCGLLGWELYLFFSHRRMTAAERESLDELLRTRTLGALEPGEPETDSGWIRCQSDRFRQGQFQDGRYTREDAVVELDHCLEEEPSYDRMQGLVYKAPLVGLLLTVLGFFVLQPPAVESGDLNEILSTLTPLILGVGTGAGLTLINLLFLQRARKRVLALRTAACHWFDDCVWKNVSGKPQAAAADAAEAARAMAETLRGSMQSYQEATAAIAQASKSLSGASAPLVQTVERLRDENAFLSNEIKELRSASISVVGAVGNMVLNVERTTSELAEAVGAVKSVVQEQFGQTARCTLQSAQLLAASVEQIREASAHMADQLSSVGQLAAGQAAATQEWSRSLREDVVPAQRAFRQAGTQLVEAAGGLIPSQRAFREAAESMQGSANTLAAAVRDGVEPATRRLADFDQVLSRLQDAAETVRQITQLRQEFADLARTLSEVASAAEAIRRRPQEIRAAVQTVARNQAARRPSRRSLFSRLLGLSFVEGSSRHNGRT